MQTSEPTAAALLYRIWYRTVNAHTPGESYAARAAIRAVQADLQARRYGYELGSMALTPHEVACNAQIASLSAMHCTAR